MADLLVLTICVPFIFILLTAFIGTLALPFLDASRKDVRDLFLAIKDLTLPMGSFPSKLLEFRTSEVVPQAIPTKTIPQTNHDVISKVTTEAIPERSVAQVVLKVAPENCSGGEGSRLSYVPKQPYIKSAAPEGERLDSDEELDDLFYDTFEYQSDQDDDAETGTPDVDGDPASEVAEGATETIIEVDQVAKNEAAKSDRINEEPAAQIAPSPAASGSTDEHFEYITAELFNMVKEKETLEAYVRQQVDPQGRCNLKAMPLGPLIRWMMREYERNTHDFRREKIKWEDENYDAKQVFEAIIVGQNLAMREMDHERGLAREEASDLVLENLDLRESSETAKEDYERHIAELTSQTRNALEAAEKARAIAEEVTAGVESRIQELKTAHTEKMSAAAFQSFQERNTLICSRRMVQDSLRDTRHQLTVCEQQHDAEIKEKNSIISGLRATVVQLKSTMTASKELAESAERGLERQLDDQRVEKDIKINALKDQVRKSQEEIKTLGTWKDKANAEERNIQRLWDRFHEDTATLREDKEHTVGGLKLEIKGLERTLGMNAATITQLRREITSLESGREVKDLKSQLGDAQKRLQRCAKTSEKWAAEKCILEQDLQQAKSVLNRNIQERFRKLEEEKENLLRDLTTARSDGQGALTQVQGLEREKVRVEEQHLVAINKKDQKIRDLEQKAAEANSRFKHEVEMEVGCRLKVAVDSKETDIREEANREYEKRKFEHEGEKQKAVKDAVEETKSIQAQLDSERKIGLEKMNEATETENRLRTEMGVLSSQLEGYKNAAGSMSTTEVTAESTGNTKERNSLAKEVDEACSLFEEIEEQGLSMICGENVLLKELNKAKKAMFSVKSEIQKPEYDRSGLLCAMVEATIGESGFHQCDSRKRPVLLRQARAANERLQSLQKLLRSNTEVELNTVLDILQSPTKDVTTALPVEIGAQDGSTDCATAHTRQGEGDLDMGEASEMQNTTTPEVLQTAKPARTLAEILATLQSMSPVSPGQAVQQDQPPQKETGSKGHGFVLPKQDERGDQPPLPGLFQPQGGDQPRLPASLPAQSVQTLRKPVLSQPPGEIKMPRGFTKVMRQWAKGWVRNRDIEQAEILLLKKFPLLKRGLEQGVVKGLRNYLAELKQQVEGQTPDQIEQPGGWTEVMTALVEVNLKVGKDTNAIISSIMEDNSYASDMEGVELYVHKLRLQYDNNLDNAQKPAGWTTDMTGTVIEELQEDVHADFERIEALLKECHDFKTDDAIGLRRYLRKLKRDFQADREGLMQHR